MRIVKKVFSVLVRVLISVALLVFLFRQVDEKSLFEVIRNAEKPILFLAFCIFSLAYILCLFRWEMLLAALKIHLPFKRVLISAAGGVFFNLFLPSSIGGDLMRSIDLSAHTQRPKEVIATVFLDRLSGFVGLVILVLLSLLMGHRLTSDKSILFSILIIIAVLVSLLFVLFNKTVYGKINGLLNNPNAGKIKEMLKDLHQEIHYFRHHKKVIVNNIILSVIIQATGPLTFFVIACALGLKIKLIYFFIFLPIIGAITMLPISIGGLGLREAITTLFFAKVGVDSHTAMAMSLLNSFFIFVWGGIGGLIYVLTVHHRRIQRRQPSAVRKS